MQALLAEGYSLRAISRALGVNRKTVDRYAARLQPDRCPCGKPSRHKGFCGHRYLKSSHHREFIAKLEADWVEPIRPARRQKLSNIRTEYPYCLGRPSDDGRALLLSVNAVVSKWLPDHARADICQDLLLSLLEGDIRIHELTQSTRAVIKKHFTSNLDRRTISLDSPRGHDGMEPLKLQDLIPHDYDRTLPLSLVTT